MNSNKDQKEFLENYQKTLKRLFATEDGRFVLDALVNAHVNSTCLVSSSEHTHYYLGKKELVMELMEDFNRVIPDKEGVEETTDLDEDALGWNY